MRGEYWEADFPPYVAFLVEDRRAEAIKPESTATLPADRFGNPTLLAVDYLFQTRSTVGDGVLTISIQM